jgi:hypothetical protein
MFKTAKFPILSAALLLAGLLPGCAVNPAGPASEITAAVALYQPRTGAADQQLLLRYAPWFEVEDYQYDYNRIGAPAARMVSAEEQRIYIDTARPTIFTLAQKFSSGGSDYTNLIYRVHFPEVPGGHLTKGHNVGLLVYVTINDREEPILITTLHTCGCYLAMVPTSNLERGKWPVGWRDDAQNIFGERLPGHLELQERVPSGQLHIRLRGDTHRVTGLGFLDVKPGTDQATLDRPLDLAPMSALEQIPLNGGYVSFFEKAGWRKGYVKESSKPWERLLMGWWALDPQVGEDKALGPAEETGTTFYTSLKFWARQASNIWNFPGFLKYWGWNF